MNAFEAKRISDTIDQSLRLEKAVRDGLRRKQRKILVLGQSESGKSTLIKQFRLLHSAETFATERQSWKSIVYLNIIRSIWKIVDTVSSCFNLTNPMGDDAQSLARLRLRLMPLRSAEVSILKSLSSPRTISRAWSNGPNSEKRPIGDMGKEHDDVVVHPDSIWQRLRQSYSYNINTTKLGASSMEGEEAGIDADDPSRTLEACASDMKKLWHCSVVRQCLKQAGLVIEDISGFFLNDIKRIASPGYVPTDDDILRCRIKTIGPTETILPCLELGLEWKIYDVGGTRRQRAKWAPFFDDMDALVVMVPVSAFDQVLAEDPTVNRLRDSFEMWGELCKTTILHHIPVLLFLNKIDLLEKKLRAGIEFSKYCASYGDRSNQLKSVLQYLNARFMRFRNSLGIPNLAPCYIHRTSIVDRATTQIIVAHVRDKIAMEYLNLSSV